MLSINLTETKAKNRLSVSVNSLPGCEEDSWCVRVKNDTEIHCSVDFCFYVFLSSILQETFCLYCSKLK